MVLCHLVNGKGGARMPRKIGMTKHQDLLVCLDEKIYDLVGVIGVIGD